MKPSQRARLFTLTAVMLGVLAAGLLWWVLPVGQPRAPAITDAKKAPRREARTPALPLLEGVSHTDDPAGGLRLEGLVTDALDQPVGQARVAIDSHPPRSGITEEDGSFFFDNLAGRVYRIMARREGLVAGPVSWRLTESSEPVMLKLESGGRLEVRVSDLLHGSPIEGAEVKLETLVTLTARADIQGMARLTGLGSGRYRVVARAAGYAPAMQWVYVAPAPGVSRQALLLARGASLSGKVMDESGMPVKGATVEAKVDFYHPTGATAATDQAGAFTFPALAAGTYHLSASHPEMAPTLSRPVTVNGEVPRSGVVITLKAGGEISGQVHLASGETAGGAVVHLAVHRYWLGRGVPQKHVVCDGEGKFRVRGLKREEMSLVAVHPLANSSEVRVDLVHQRQAQARITLDRNLTISGQVVDPMGQPVPRAQVTGDSTRRQLSNVMNKAQARAFTDMGGRFVLRGLKQGSYRLFAHLPGQDYYHSGSTQVVQSGQQNVSLLFAGTGGIKGRVLFADGSAPELFWVDPRHGRQVAFDGGQGKFKLDKLPARKQDLRIQGPDFQLLRIADLRLEPGEVLDVGTVTVKRGRKVSGQVTDSRGAPVASALVLLDSSIYQSGDWITSFTDGVNPWDKQARTGSAGTFTFRGVGEEALLMAAEHPRLGRSPFQRVPAGTEDSTVKLELAGVSALEGTVTRQGSPVVADITLSPVGKAWGNGDNKVRLNQTSGQDGYYRFARLVPGRYQARARRKTMFNQRVRERVVWTEVTTQGGRLDIELPTGATLEVHLKRGSEINASVNLCPGVVQVRTMAALDSWMKSQAKACPHAFLTSGMNKASFLDVAPGKYSVCVWLITKRAGEPWPDKQGPARARDTFCQEAQVTDAPLIQPLTMNLK